MSDQTPKLVSVTERSKRIVHYVKANENLWGIAEHYYGDGAYWRSIVEANLIVKMGAGRATGRAHVADDVAPFDLLSLFQASKLQYHIFY